MSFNLTKWAIQELQIPQTQKSVLVAICSFADDSGVAFPSQETIAKSASVDIKTVSRTIQKLVELGLISIIKKGVYQVIKGDLNAPKVTETHHKGHLEGDLNAPQGDLNAPKRDGNAPTYNKPINIPINKSENTKNRFQEFWEKYPVSRREGKTKTETAYRVVIGKISEADLHKALDAQLKQWEAEKTQDKFKKYIIRWLRDEVYEKFLVRPQNNLTELSKAIQAADQGMRWNDTRYRMTLQQARQLVGEKKCEAA